MTDLSPRQRLIEDLTDRLDAAMQSDLENGVRSLNAKAAESFKSSYPALNQVINWIHDLYIEEMPDD